MAVRTVPDSRLALEGWCPAQNLLLGMEVPLYSRSVLVTPQCLELVVAQEVEAQEAQSMLPTLSHKDGLVEQAPVVPQAQGEQRKLAEPVVLETRCAVVGAAVAEQAARMVVAPPLVAQQARTPVEAEAVVPR